MEKLFMCLLASLISYTFASSCTTPLGELSQCVSLYDCPSLLEATKLKPVPNNVGLFLRNSKCKSDDNNILVCCGPLPFQNIEEPTRYNYSKSYNSNNNGSNVKVNSLPPNQIEPGTEEDTKLPPKCICGAETNRDMIYGGTATELNDFPWMTLQGYREHSCTTPFGGHGQCVSLSDCPSLHAALKLKPIPYTVGLLLRDPQCGFVGYTKFVCCGRLPFRKIQKHKFRKPNFKHYQTNYYINNGNSSNVKVNNLPPDQIEPVTDEDTKLPSKSTCGVETNGDRIYGGTATELDEFPWMALLGYRQRTGGLTYQCGGSLINQRYVLTAAHCITGQIEDFVGKLETIRLGEYDKRTEVDCLFGTCADRTQEIPILVAVAHPGYMAHDISRKDDIGIARLARRAQYSYFVKPICLVNSDVRLDEGIQLFVAGWGQTITDKSSDVKQKLGISIFRKSECISKYIQLNATINDKQICAGGKLNEDTCVGDSGGPLMRKLPEGIWESVGVVSFGLRVNGSCGIDGWPGIYTSVAHYLDWIEQAMRSTNV